MASDTVFDAVKAYLTDGRAALPVAWENESFTKPNPPSAWVAVEMTGTLYGQQSIGAGSAEENRWDEEGQLWLHVFVPKGSGGSAIRGHAKRLADLFRGTLLVSDTLEFLDASIGMGDPGETDGLWFRVSVSIDWRRVEA